MLTGLVLLPPAQHANLSYLSNAQTLRPVCTQTSNLSASAGGTFPAWQDMQVFAGSDTRMWLTRGDR